jgi:hypothetical protein
MDIGTLAGAIIGSSVLGEIVKFLLEKRKAAKKPDLSDTDYDELIGDIIAEIRDELGAYRCSYWAAQNGENTLDGYSIKKLSMVVERNAEDADNIAREMQGLPSITFKRTIKDLKESENGCVISYEGEMDDQLSNLNKAYGIQSLISCKVNNLKHGVKWTGILSVGFEERNRKFQDTQIAWLMTQINRIEVLISKI